MIEIKNKIRKVDNMLSFDEFYQIVKSYKQNKKRFEVTKMDSSMFVSTEALEVLTTNRKKDKRKVKVNWLAMKVEKSKPGVLMFKYNHDPETPYDELDLKKRLGGPVPIFRDAVLEPLHPNGHSISDAKYADILHLLNYVPPVHHDFYKSLQQAVEVVDCVP